MKTNTVGEQRTKKDTKQEALFRGEVTRNHQNYCTDQCLSKRIIGTIQANDFQKNECTAKCFTYKANRIGDVFIRLSKKAFRCSGYYSKPRNKGVELSP